MGSIRMVSSVEEDRGQQARLQCVASTACKLLTGTKSEGSPEALVGLDNYSVACLS